MKPESTALSATIAGLILFGLVGSATGVQTAAYRFDDVYSKVTLDSGEKSTKAETGMEAHGGDVVRTGWRGRATVAADEVASRFEIYPSSRVKLASDKPGVIVMLERGRLKAMFDAITGNDERIVETPGALLAVRGTRYGVEVDSSGDTLLSVFEGMVEVRPFDPSMEALLVRPGEVGRFGPKQAPRMVMRGVDEKTWTDRGGSRSLPGMKDSQGSHRPDDAQMPGRDGGDMTGKGSQPSSGGGSRKPH
jgi:hypothetical protein